MRRRLAIALVLPVMVSVLRAQEGPAPIAVESSGVVPVDVERRVIVDGLAGDLVFQVGNPGEMRFLSRKMGKKDEVPVALFEERGTLVFRPPPGEAFTARTFQLSVPPELLVRVQAPGGGQITVSGLRGGMEIVGRALNVDARGLACDVEMDLEGGTAIVSSVEGNVRLRGSGPSVTFDNVRGAVTIAVAQGAVTVRGAESLDADTDGVALKVERVKGAAHVIARGGTIEATAIGQGGSFKLTGTPIVISKSKGDITVSSDTDVTYSEMEADLHLDVYGGSVQGAGNTGMLEVRARNTPVTIARNTAAVRVQGDGLTLKLSDVGGETFVSATASDLDLTNISGTTTVEGDRSDLVLTRASLAVQAKVTGGDVRMTEISGSVDLSADGASVEISWGSMPDKDSRIVNTGGEVVVRFPVTSAGCRIEAHSKSGRVESNLQQMRILDDGSRAVGSLGNAQRPNVYVEAERDIQILTTG